MKKKGCWTALMIAVAGAVLVSGCSKEEDLSPEGETTESEGKAGGGTGSGATSGTTDGHEWVDLGLPSGTLWATCNVGASKPEEYGSYFAWGEVEPKEEYNWNNYKWCDGSSSNITKYLVDKDNTETVELEAADDAATRNWGSRWQMPSLLQIQELYKMGYTTVEWTTQGGVNGRRITSKSNGNSIFLPAAGCDFEIPVDNGGISGGCWSRTLCHPGTAYCLYFSSGYIHLPDESVYMGFCIRPVRRQ